MKRTSLAQELASFSPISYSVQDSNSDPRYLFTEVLIRNMKSLRLLAGAAECEMKFLLTSYQDLSLHMRGDQFIPLVKIAKIEKKELRHKTIEYPLFSPWSEKVGHFSALFTERPSDQTIACVQLATQAVQSALTTIFLLEKQERNTEEIIAALVTTLKTKDPYTYIHSRSVQRHASFLSKVLGFSSEKISLIRVSGLLHDMGKIQLPLALLQKDGSLTDQEYKQIKFHPVFGYDYLVRFSFPILQSCAIFARSHHERWDGKGYPDNLKGENIPIEARILAIADAYDAMVGIRPYRNSISPEEALDELSANAGTQFDPTLVKNFYYAMKQKLQIPI